MMGPEIKRDFQMSSKSRQKIGWLSRFLSLLIGGPAKPEAETATDKATETIQVVANLTLVAAALEAEAIVPIAKCESAVIETAGIETADANKSLDWQKAREFRLAARLSVTAQLNRPKSVDKQIRKIKTPAAHAPAWNRPAKPILRQANPLLDSAVVINFPTLGNADKRLAEAA